MFSQYSWWDFVKFVLALAIPYYGYVLWSYYREDIQEWLSNRGQPKPDSPASQDREESGELNQPARSLYAVNQYADEDEANSPRSTSQNRLDEESAQTQPVMESNDEEVDMSGPVVHEQPETVFYAPLAIAAENLQEQSLQVILEAAGRMSADEQGVLSPLDADDQPAAKLAHIINQQHGHPFADIAFTR